MPLYEYECPVCSSSEGKALRFEVRQGYNDKAMVRCPKCKSVCKRLISGTPHYWKDGVPD
jgi:putative FmdB family regulatory protein